MTVATPQPPTDPRLVHLDRSCARVEHTLGVLMEHPSCIGYQLAFNGIRAVLGFARRWLAHPVARDLLLLCAEQAGDLFREVGATHPAAPGLCVIDKRLRAVAALLPSDEVSS